MAIKVHVIIYSLYHYVYTLAQGLIKGLESSEQADGFIFGFPSRFGVMPAQVKAFLDNTGGLWAKGALNGKMVGTFVTTGTQRGGQETTALTAIPYFVNHGIIYVPLGFTDSELSDTSEIIGGTPFGDGTIAGADGSRQPSSKELALARSQGQSFGKIVTAYTNDVNKTN